MALITIIANFYKSEKYIPKLIESVIGQTFTDWELLCVNDCSPGKDKEVILKYVERDERIRLIDNEVNLGICKAKMEGLKNARSKYVTFIDGDDWFAPEALQRMVEPAEEYELDMVVMNYYRALPAIHYNKPFPSQTDKWNTPIYQPEVFDKYFMNFFGEFLFSVAYWGKLYRKDVIETSGFQPPEVVFAEDFVFSMTIFPYVKSLMFVDYFGYYWRWGGYSAGKKSEFWTAEKGMLRCNEVYVDKLNLVEQYNYSKAYLPLLKQHRLDILNYCSDLTTYPINSKEANNVVPFIRTVLDGEGYEKLNDLRELDDSFSDDELLNCILSKDAEGVYGICHKKWKSEKRVRLMKRLLYLLTTLF